MAKTKIKPGPWQLKDKRIVFVDRVEGSTVRFMWKLSLRQDQMTVKEFTKQADFLVDHAKHEIDHGGRWRAKAKAKRKANEPTAA